jgi:hypothetical protein
MTRAEFIKVIAAFAEKETQSIIAQLQAQRFENDGAFNGHPEWERNSGKVAKEKGFDKPLYDSGELEHELETDSNWKLAPKFSGNTLTLSVPDREQFTDSKYDVLDTGGEVEPYKGRRTGNWINIFSVPARPFKDITAQDMEWIKEMLVLAIIRKFG